MGNYASEPVKEPVVVPVVPELDLSIDWGTVLEFLKARDYENAAALMCRDEKYKKSLANMDYGTLMKDRLEYVFRSQIIQSIVDSNYSDATVFSILYSEIGGEKAIILDFLAKHVERGLKTAVDEIEAKVGQQRSATGLKNYPEIVGKFLNHAMSIMQSFAFLEEIYDVQNYLKFLKGLQRPKGKPELASIQEYCVKFINEFLASRNINYFLSLAKAGNVHNSVDSTNMQLVNLLSEIAILVLYVDNYAQFLRKQYELKSKGYTFSAEVENESKKLLNINNYVSEPVELYNLIENLLPSYLVLEKFSITIGIDAALRLKEEPSDGMKTSTMISDVFAILLASIQRSYSTNAAAIKEIVHHSSTCCSLFAGTLATRCLKVMPNTIAVLRSSLAIFSVYLNDIEQSSAYALKLKQDCEDIALVTLKSNEHADVIELLKVFDSVATQFTLKQKEVLFKFSTAIFKQLIAKETKVFSEFDYRMDINKFKEAQVNDPWVENFFIQLNPILEIFEGIFLDDVFVNLIFSIVDLTTNEIYLSLLTKKMTQTGGLQFEREVQMISDFFKSKIPNHKFKIRFKKLNEIKEILIVEKMADLMEYWNPQSEITWQLTRDEVKRLLRCRVEFSETEINKLIL